jgi:hypothetical protein
VTRRDAVYETRAVYRYVPRSSRGRIDFCTVLQCTYSDEHGKDTGLVSRFGPRGMYAPLCSNSHRSMAYIIYKIGS